MNKEESSRLGKGIANVFGEFYKNYTTTMSKTKLNKRMKMRAAPMCIKTTPM